MKGKEYNPKLDDYQCGKCKLGYKVSKAHPKGVEELCPNCG